MKTNEEFVDRLVYNVPALREIFDEHMSDYEEILPHVFLGDVARYVVTRSGHQREDEQIKEILAIFEDGLQRGSGEVKELVAVSFIENLFGEVKALRVLLPLMGPNLSSETKRIHNMV